ncbi:hypothetical protein GCM10010176_036300 [Nonomuraea spiralis]|nr:hypothetical protein GCM10010176_036300 [Nonomuraea spiralis]
MSEESGAQDYLNRIKAYFQAQDAVREGRAATIWDAPGVFANAPSAAKLSLLNAPLVEQREAMAQRGTTRTASAVELSNPAIHAMLNGNVEVTVSVKRAWTEQDSGSTVRAGRSPRDGGHSRSRGARQSLPSN